MDTKSRSYSHSILVKIIAFILVVVSFTSMVFISLEAMGNIEEGFLNSPFEENYYLSKDYQREITDALFDITSLAVKYKSEENIMSGKFIDKDELERRKEELFNEITGNYNDYHSDEYNESEGIEEAEVTEETSSETTRGITGTTTTVTTTTKDDSYGELRNKFETEHKEEIEELKNKLIKEDLDHFRDTLDRLEQKKGLVYFVKQGETVFSNAEKNSMNDFREYPAYVISKGREYELYPVESEDVMNRMNWEDTYTGGILSKVDQVRIAFTEDYIGQKLTKWGNSRYTIENVMNQLIVLFTVLILSLTYLFVITGRNKFKDNSVDMSKIDKLYTDVNALLMLFIISLVPIFGFNVSRLFNFNISKSSFVMIATFSALSCGLVLVLMLSLVRHIKNKSFFSHSLTITIVRKVYGFGKDIYGTGSVGTKVAIAVIVYPLITVISVIFFPITIGFAVWITSRKVKEYIAIKDGVERIKNGEMDYKIKIDHDGEFKSLSEGINTIGEGFNSAIANELKSERLKTELITNVSHDIRTPLTSIITYVDLIKNEADQSKINEYINIIEQKSLRLKTLTDDLFEASKASSGNIPVNFEKIDIVSLITQGLGELDTQVRESNLDFIINNKTEKIFVSADGRLLWRAIENLLTNIFKYSLKGSRVYIDLIDLEDKISLSIKNISAYELNISSDELMERFKRGDESRSSEGSGLGLSISKSLIDAQGGKFEIFIDGDLFKVVISLLKF